MEDLADKSKTIQFGHLGHVIDSGSIPAPVPLDAARARPMPNDILSGWLGAMVDAVAIATETPRELAAMMALGAVATATQKRFSVCPEKGYFEPTNIWVTCSLASGNRKLRLWRP
jgi:replicative DNA helicase